MRRDEILEQIRKTEQYIERSDIMDAQREAAEERYFNLVALLGTMPDEPEVETAVNAQEPATISASPEVQEKINDIWQMLDPEGKRRKRA